MQSRSCITSGGDEDEGRSVRVETFHLLPYHPQVLVFLGLGAVIYTKLLVNGIF